VSRCQAGPARIGRSMARAAASSGFSRLPLDPPGFVRQEEETNHRTRQAVEEPLRDSRTLAVQLRDRIADLIREEGLKPGDRLPTEAQLTQRFRISRPALREALKLLEQDDVIYVEHGRGRFVSA